MWSNKNWYFPLTVIEVCVTIKSAENGFGEPSSNSWLVSCIHFCTNALLYVNWVYFLINASFLEWQTRIEILSFCRLQSDSNRTLLQNLFIIINYKWTILTSISYLGLTERNANGSRMLPFVFLLFSYLKKEEKNSGKGFWNKQLIEFGVISPKQTYFLSIYSDELKIALFSW